MAILLSVRRWWWSRALAGRALLWALIINYSLSLKFAQRATIRPHVKIHISVDVIVWSLVFRRLRHYTADYSFGLILENWMVSFEAQFGDEDFFCYNFFTGVYVLHRRGYFFLPPFLNIFFSCTDVPVLKLNNIFLNHKNETFSSTFHILWGVGSMV